MGAEFVIDNLEDMCNLMCNNQMPRRKKGMDKVLYDVRVYANDVVDRLNGIKDRNLDKLSRNEIETLNDGINLIMHNIKEIVRE